MFSPQKGEQSSDPKLQRPMAPEPLLRGWTADLTPSLQYVPMIRGIFGRQITTSCSTSGWIPCTAYPSDRGCRPPGGTCCIDGNYCDIGFVSLFPLLITCVGSSFPLRRDCVNVPGRAEGACCARGKTCSGTTRQCKKGGSSLCPEKDYCCGGI